MSAPQVAASLLAHCAEERAWQARWAADHPADTRRLQRHAAALGFASTTDDPIIRVRASQIEAVCAAVLPADYRTALIYALRDVDDLAPVEADALAWLEGAA